MNSKNDLSLIRQINELIDKGNKASLCKFLIKYNKKVTKSKSALLCIKSPSEQYEIYYSKIIEDAAIEEKIKNQLIQSFMESKKENIFNIYVDKTRYQAINIESLYDGLGILAIESNGLNTKRKLNYLSCFISAVLNEFRLRQVKNDLLVNEEQNRIAEEIHDTVCQRLFSLSCASHNLRKNLSELSKDEIENQLMLINESIYKANKQLRKTIYDLSYKKNGSNIFVEEISDYVNNISKLTKVEISLNIIGEEKFLDLSQKKAMYRILCESIGNSICHGKAKKLDIDLDIKDSEVLLEIKDDGRGFNSDYTKTSKIFNGIGITNIKDLTEELQGKFEIETCKGKGTNIKIAFTNRNFAQKEVIQAV